MPVIHKVKKRLSEICVLSTTDERIRDDNADSIAYPSVMYPTDKDSDSDDR